LDQKHNHSHAGHNDAQPLHDDGRASAAVLGGFKLSHKLLMFFPKFFRRHGFLCAMRVAVAVAISVYQRFVVFPGFFQLFLYFVRQCCFTANNARQYDRYQQEQDSDANEDQRNAAHCHHDCSR